MAVRSKPSSPLTDGELEFARAVSALIGCNPFLPERIELERRALGGDYVPAGVLWHAVPEAPPTPNLLRLRERVEVTAEKLRAAFGAGTRPTTEARALYEDLVVYLLFERYEEELYRLVSEPGVSTARVACYGRFEADIARWLGASGLVSDVHAETPHLFACFFQIRRAFHHIFRNILGGSLPAARLRATVWQSIFTRDLKRYRRGLYARMGDVATLISGPSGTGKELVARAIGLARYIPFDRTRQSFAEDFAGSFHALALSALSPTLIESELFGHRRGAFTGALTDRAGWLEVCPPLGTVFLDEIGELDVALQVKLLRVLQSRTFQRIGDTRDRRFAGKIIAATNRDLPTEIATGRFRTDLYYRLCSDIITTPSLAEQLRDAPGERRTLVRFIAGRVAGDAEAEALTAETEQWIDTHLGAAYAWPGNVRELEQCVRNVMIRGEYRPPAAALANDGDELAAALRDGALTADELLRRYCRLVYERTGSYQETARRLGLDRRTVRDKIGHEG